LTGTATTASYANGLNAANTYTVSQLVTTGKLEAGGNVIAGGQFSGAGTGLTGTAASLTAGTANSVAWTNVSSRPTAVSSFTNDSLYQYHRGDITSLSSSATNVVQPLGTFDGSNITNAPTSGWYNYLSSTHGSYLTSLIANLHRTADWYVGYKEGPGGTPTNPSWYKLLHSGNYTDYTVTKTGTGASGTWAITSSWATNANAVSFTEVELNAPVTVSGTWTSGNGSEWGEPKFGTSFNQFRYTDGNGPYVEYNIPANHHACFISQLQWDTGGYADCHGVQSDGDLVFLRRINTRQLVENSNHGNTIQHDGATVSFVGSGLQAFTKIRITNRSGRIHMTGIAFTRQIDDGYEGTGMVHPAQISHQGSGSGLDADLLDGYNSATANTANTIVLRDASGNFSAGTITATLSGTATIATTANALNTSNSYTGVNFLATGFLQSNSGNIKSDTSFALLTTTNGAQSVSVRGILLGTSYDTTPGANEIRTTNNTSLYLNARGTGDIQFQTADSLKMMLLNNGNVGIGTSSPTAKLESYFSSNAVTINYLATNLNNNSPIPVYGFDVTNGSGETRSIKAGIGYERHLTNGRGTLHFYNDSTNDTQSLSGNRTSAGDIKMSIDNDGNVGIGTPTPTYKLQVQGSFYVNSTAYINGALTVDDNLNLTAGNDFIITDSDGTGTYNFFMDSGVGYIRIDDGGSANGKLNINSGLLYVGASGGNVGINTTSPSALLNVRASTPTGTGTITTGTNILIDSNTNNYITFRNTADNGTYAGLVFLDNNVGGYIAFGNAGAAVGSDSMIYGAYQDHIFQNNYVNETLYNRTETMRIKQSGNVGIGTSNPGRKLDVEGIVRTRGASGTGGFEIGAASSGAAKWRIEWDSASDSLDFNWVG